MSRSLIFLKVETRPDIAFATLVVSRFTKNLLQQHTEVMKTIFQYPKATKTVEITCSGDKKKDPIIRGYFDSDWAGEYATRKSNSGFISMLNKDLVSWYLKWPATVVLLSIEAEYVILALATKEAIWMI